MKTHTGLKHWLVCITVSVSSAGARGDDLSAGNLLISTEDVLYEYTPSGQYVQSFTIPDPKGAAGSARDIVAPGFGYVHVYNGTFEPHLSSLDVTSELWEHQPYPGWTTVNNGSYGGIDIWNRNVFVTDMSTALEGSPEGIIRFDLVNEVEERFAEDIDPIDLTVGLDGLLYALYPGGSPGGRFVDVYDPEDLSFQGTISLADIFGHTAHRAIAVGPNGDMFIADWDGDLQKIDADGNILLETNICDITTCNLYDINLSEDGRLVIGDRSGGVTLTDVDFSEFANFSVGDRGTFVTFVPPNCIADVDGDGYVGPLDLANLLGWWGPCEPDDPCHDVDADANGDIGPFDLAVLLNNWGPCP